MASSNDLNKSISPQQPDRPDFERDIDEALSPLENSEDAWKKRNLLSLDGGGIRGYWSLLVLRRLMEAIGDVEREHISPSSPCHSFEPEELPPRVTQIKFTHEELAQQNEAEEQSRPRCNEWPDARRFLPCHYFDYIYGSSTGSLIAIMLGRFRMTVDDCIVEYKSLGHEIFGNPRPISQRNIFIVPWSKYSSKSMAKVFKNVVQRRSERQRQVNVMFPPASQQGICHTFVTTLKYEHREGSEASKELLYLIRSYDHIKMKHGSRRNTGIVNHFPGRAVVSRATTFGSSNPIEPEPQQRLQRVDNSFAQRIAARNHGPADNWKTYKVALAATAAPLYFPEVVITHSESDSSTEMHFSDGGFGHTNNPTKVGIEEIECLHGKGTIGIVVSVGTARADDTPGGKKNIFKRVKQFANTATDPKQVAEGLVSWPDYWRFNDERGLDIELDEWKPNGIFTKNPGHKTLKKIDDAWAKWAADRVNIRKLEECARELVDRRRQRKENGARWQRYASVTRYHCNVDGCEESASLYRDNFLDHLRKEHYHDLRENDDRIPKPEVWEYQESSNH